jgi:hypothetical protein
MRLCSCLLVVILLFSNPALAQEESTSSNTASGDSAAVSEVSEVARLSLLVLRKEIELQRFNIGYRLTVAKQGRWKGLRYFLSQETNAALSLSGGIIGINERFKNFESVNKINVRNLETGNILSIAGQTVGAAGSGLEFAINTHHHLQARKKGYSTKTANSYVRRLKAEIDALLQKRASAAKSLEGRVSAQQTAIFTAEGRVLDDIRDLALAEYVQFMSGQTSYLGFQQALYLLDITRNTTGALGNLFAYISNVQADPTLNTEAGILFTTNGALTVATPYLSRAIGYAVRKLKKHSVKDIADKTVDADVQQLCRDIDILQDLCKNSTLKTVNAVYRAALYDSHGNQFLKQLALSTRETNARNYAAVENVTAGTAIGATKLAAGVEFIVAGVRYSDSKRRTNVLISTAGTASLVGTSISLLDNIRIQLKTERNNRRLAGKRQLPSQVLNDRMQHLEELDRQIVSLLSNSTN